MTVEQRVNEYVDRKHLNMSAIAKALNMNRDAFYGIVHGRRKMSAQELINFCNEVNITVDDFLNAELE